jgi:hypothetical protein
MSADIIFLPWPEVDEAHFAFRERFNAWRNKPAAEREPQGAPRQFPSHFLPAYSAQISPQMALPLIGASSRSCLREEGRRA